MEQSGRNGWQPVATGDGKEGVDGSSPSEGSAHKPRNRSLSPQIQFRCASTRFQAIAHWSRSRERRF